MTLSAQGTLAIGDVDTYVALLNGNCPIVYEDSWAVNSMEADGDTVHVVFQTPSSLAGFLPQLTGEGDNFKRMWVKQLKTFGYPWADFFRRMAEAGCTLVITFQPKDSRKTSTQVFYPEDYAALSDVIYDE